MDVTRTTITSTFGRIFCVSRIPSRQPRPHADGSPSIPGWGCREIGGTYSLLSAEKEGVVHTFYPDFIIRLVNGEMLVLETKGKDDQQNRTKREFLDEWCRAVNTHGGFGT